MQDETNQEAGQGPVQEAETGRDAAAAREQRWAAVAETNAEGVSIHPQAVLSRREQLAEEQQTYAGASALQRDERAWRLAHLLDHARNLRAVRDLLHALDAGKFSEEDRRLGVPEADRDQVLQAYEAHLASLFEEVARLDQIDRALDLQEMIMCSPHDRTVFYLSRQEADVLDAEARARNVPLDTVLSEALGLGLKLVIRERQAALEALGRDSQQMAEAAGEAAKAMADTLTSGDTAAPAS